MRRNLRVVVVTAVMTTTGMAAGRGLSARLGGQNGGTASVSAETVDNAGAYFDRARKLGFPAAGQTAPYQLKAEFTTRAASGAVATGTYTDTWVSEKQWRREAKIGESRFVRSRNGKKWYRLDDGPDATLLQFVLTALEPLPDPKAGEKDKWKIEPSTAGGATTTKVWRGKENSDETPDPQHFEAYWFDAGGQLTRSYLNGLEIQRDKFEAFSGVQVARQLQVSVTGKVGMKINITDVQPLGKVDTKMFTLKGNDWQREYTSEVR